MAIPAYDGYIFDLDGTIYLGDAALPGAVETLATLRAAGRKIAFLSNNPTHTREAYVQRLRRLGVDASIDQIINSSLVMTRWLLREAPGARLFVIGEQPLIDELVAAGFALSERAGEIDVVVASFDRTFTYHKLQVAFDAIRAGARLVATNADRYCPVPGGGQPDAAAIIAAIEACTSTRIEQVVGKPSPITVAEVAALLQLPLERCIMVGDRLETDVAMGVRAGMASALVLTGATPRAALDGSDIRPDYVLDTIAPLAEAL
ncbi:HAD-IIA family hydrolase [Chloroflexia bacterium SDU3-3]|nr:HAD-IIA family hydrolase [Chloroflexia bacterium SDU3-3]